MLSRRGWISFYVLGFIRPVKAIYWVHIRPGTYQLVVSCIPSKSHGIGGGGEVKALSHPFLFYFLSFMFVDQL